MKKTASTSVCVLLCIWTAIFTVTALIFECVGYNIEIIGIKLLSAVPYTVLVFLCCACFLIYKHEKNVVIKTVAMILSAPAICFLCSILFFRLIFGGFGENTVVQTVESQSGKCCAEVIDSDQGALGGNTYVNVYEKCIMKTPVLTVQKKPKQIYSGKWGEYKKMQIYWKDDNCLVINSVEYEIE